MIILDVRVSDIQPRPRAGQWIRSSIPLLTFVTLGLPAGALGVAWPYMRASFGAPLAGLGLVLATFTIACFLASATSGPLTGRLGTSGLLVGGCTLSPVAWSGLALAPARGVGTVDRSPAVPATGRLA